MEPYEYRTLFEFESSYWWYRGLHAILLDTLRWLGLGADALVLDAGCGTGQNLANIARDLTPWAFGFDLSPHAAPFWAQRGLRRVCLASINDIPFPDDTFDAVISVDVLECDAVCQDRAYGELWRVVRTEGFIILVVPAYEWLLTEEHHRAVRASRRYSKQQVLSLLRKQPIDLSRVTHLFGLLLPAVASYRLAVRYLARGSNERPRSELRRLHPILNHLLLGIVSAERRILRRRDLPFGSSIMAVARKVGR